MAHTKITTRNITDDAVTSAKLDTNIAISGTLSAGGAITGTLATAAQTNITSLGTLTGLTGGTGDLVWDTTTLVVDSSANKVGIGTASPASLLHINGSGDAIRVESTNTGAGGAQVDLLHFTSSPADDDVHGVINFGGYYSGTNSVYGSSIKSVWTDVSAKEAALEFYTKDDSTFTHHLKINHHGGIAIGAGNNGYDGQVLSVKAGSNDNVFYGESSDANCIVSLRDNSSTANIGYGANANAHILSRDGVEKFRFDGSNLHLVGGSDARIQLSTSGSGNAAVSNNTVHIRGDNDNLKLNAAANGGIFIEEDGTARLSIASGGFTTIENGGTDFGVAFKSQSGGSNRSGFVVHKPGTSTVLGSALTLGSDESYRFGTASHYHQIMMQDGRTSIMGDDNEVFRAGSDRLWSLATGSYAQGHVRVYVAEGTLNNGSTLNLFNNSSAHTDIHYWMVLEAFHSGRTYRTSIGTIGGYGWNATNTGSGANFNNYSVASGRQGLNWSNNSGYSASYYIAAYIWGDSGVTVENGAISALI
jgi:hypothetical protein